MSLLLSSSGKKQTGLIPQQQVSLSLLLFSNNRNGNWRRPVIYASLARKSGKHAWKDKVLSGEGVGKEICVPAKPAKYDSLATQNTCTISLWFVQIISDLLIKFCSRPAKDIFTVLFKNKFKINNACFNVPVIFCFCDHTSLLTDTIEFT